MKLHVVLKRLLNDFIMQNSQEKSRRKMWSCVFVVLYFIFWNTNTIIQNLYITEVNTYINKAKHNVWSPVSRVHIYVPTRFNTSSCAL